jgi:hypothetical protein
VALAWLLARSPVMLPIPGTSAVAHLEENLTASTLRRTDDEFQLLGSDVSRLMDRSPPTPGRFSVITSSGAADIRPEGDARHGKLDAQLGGTASWDRRRGGPARLARLPGVAQAVQRPLR